MFVSSCLLYLGCQAAVKQLRASFGISFFLTLESHSFSVLMLMKDTSPFAPVITPSCSQRTMRSMSSPSFHLRYLQTRNPASYFSASFSSRYKNSAESFHPLFTTSV